MAVGEKLFGTVEARIGGGAYHQAEAGRVGFLQQGHKGPRGIDLSHANAVEEEGGTWIRWERRSLPEASPPIGPPFSSPQQAHNQDRAGNQCPNGVKKVVSSLHSTQEAWTPRPWV